MKLNLMEEFGMLKTIICETDRLILRRYCKSDLDDLYENGKPIWKDTYIYSLLNI